MFIKPLTGLAAAVVTGVAGFAIPAGAQTSTGNAGSTPPASTHRAAACSNPDAHWPAYVQGKPDAFDAGDNGVYLWHNPSGGWGLRVSHPQLPGKANRVVFTGTVVSKGKIGNVVKVRDEKGDVVKVGPKGHTLRFRFVDYGGVDGVDFTTTCTPGLAVSLKADKSTLSPQYIHLGDKKVNPGSDPFAIRRRDTDTGTTAATPKAGGGKKGAPNTSHP